MKLLIIADDFTGAMDTGAQIARHSVNTGLIVEPGRISQDAENYEALAINADTRHDSPDKAYTKTVDILKRFDGQWEHLYIKTDSVLRGNLSAIFRAVKDYLSQPVFFVPAYPDAGRITCQGKQYVGGVPLEKSVFNNDPLNPMTHSEVSSILTKTHPLDVQLVKEGEKAAFDAGYPDVAVFDCQDNDTMAHIGAYLRENSLNRVMAGCAGFASTLADNIPFRLINNEKIHYGGQAAVLSGSANAVTFQQVEHASRAGIPVFVIPPQIKVNPTPRAVENFINEIESNTGSNPLFVITTATSAKDLDVCDQILRDYPGVDIHQNISEIFACLGEHILSRTCNLVVFGGDTVLAILRRIGCCIVNIRDEIISGVPVCDFEYHNKNIRLVTKSGGLASVEAVSLIGRYFEGNFTQGELS